MYVCLFACMDYACIFKDVSFSIVLLSYILFTPINDNIKYFENEYEYLLNQWDVFNWCWDLQQKRHKRFIIDNLNQLKHVEQCFAKMSWWWRKGRWTRRKREAVEEKEEGKKIQGKWDKWNVAFSQPNNTGPVPEHIFLPPISFWKEAWECGGRLWGRRA